MNNSLAPLILLLSLWAMLTIALCVAGLVLDHRINHRGPDEDDDTPLVDATERAAGSLSPGMTTTPRPTRPLPGVPVAQYTASDDERAAWHRDGVIELETARQARERTRRLGVADAWTQSKQN